MFDHLGKFVSRHWAWVLTAWVVLLAAILLTAPPWASISQDDDIKSFPADFDSVVGYDLLRRAFPNDVFNSQVVVVVERSDGEISELDVDFVADTLAARLATVQRGGERRDAEGNIVEDKFGLGEFLTPKTAGMANLLVSRDRRCALLVAPCRHTFMAEAVIATIEALRAELGTMRQRGEVPAGLQVAVSGSAGVGADIQIESMRSLDISRNVTIVLVLVILLLVYRSPLVAMIPLVTIGVSVATSMGLMALMTLVPWMRFQVMKITEIFVIVVLFGAGTDYCLFLIARYREELQHGNDRPTALRLAVRNVGGALAASAATVVCGLGMMIFAEFGKFRYTGPAVAISLAVAVIGSLTLTPALLRLLGPIVFWRPRILERLSAKRSEAAAAGASEGDPHASAFQQQFWEDLSHWLVRRPATIWIASIALLLPFAVWGWNLTPTYDFLAELADSAESKFGLHLLQEHYPKGTLGPLTVLIELPNDANERLGADKARAHIEELTRRIHEGRSKTRQYYAPELVASVRSLTRPLGEPVEHEPAAPEPQANEPEPTPSPFGRFLAGVGRMNKENIVDPSRENLRKQALEHYVSSATDGRVTRLDVVFNVAPFSIESMHLRDGVDQLVRDFTAERDTVLAGAKHAFAGITSSTYDLRKITISDKTRINMLVVVVVYLVLVLLLRMPLRCVYLMFTVLFGYYATLGMTEGVFYLLHHWTHPAEPWLGLDWKVAFFLFIILVAVGEDYNILLMSRVVEEERKLGGIEGVRTAVARTGGIITSCGVIMTGTFGSMCVGTLAAIVQLGFALGLGVLLDTFVVRPILVPAFLLMLHRWREPRPKAGVPSEPHIARTAPQPVESIVP